MRVPSDLPPLSDGTLSGVTGPATLPHSVRSRQGQVVGSVLSWALALSRWRLGLSNIRWIIGAFQAVALFLAGTVFAGLVFPGQVGASLGLLLPLSLMLSVSLFGYVVHLRSTYPGVFAAELPPWRAVYSRAYLLTLLALGLVAGYGWRVFTVVMSVRASPPAPLSNCRFGPEL